MGAPKKTDWREERRKRAWELKRQGWKQQEIAEALGVTEGAVSQWMKRAREGGEAALKAHPAKGAKPRLTAEQQAQIPAVLAKGALAYGFQGEVWTSRRLAVVIKREFGVSYHPDHCGYLVRKMGYSMQKPVERASQRNEPAIEQWKTQHWPQLKKAEQEKRTIVFVDEAGFYLLPMIVRTYAPRGQPPVLRVKLTRDHLSAIGGITQTGRLFMQMQEHAYKAEDVVRFLQMLLHKISGNVLLIWDGSPIHRAEVIKQFLSTLMGKRVHLERLPGYAPDLNPQELVWNLLKRCELKNLCCQDLAHLRQELVRAKERLRHRQEILQHCFTHALAEV
jgi:transposase